MSAACNAVDTMPRREVIFDMSHVEPPSSLAKVSKGWNGNVCAECALIAVLLDRVRLPQGTPGLRHRSGATGRFLVYLRVANNICEIVVGAAAVQCCRHGPAYLGLTIQVWWVVGHGQVEFNDLPQH